MLGRTREASSEMNVDGMQSSEGKQVELLYSRLLDILRQELKMDIVWVSELVSGQHVIRAVSGDDIVFKEIPEGIEAYDGSYCERVLAGELPSVIRNAQENPIASVLPITDRLQIGSYVGVPIMRTDGALHGMLASISRTPLSQDPPLGVLKMIAKAVGEVSERRSEQRNLAEAKRSRIQKTIAEKRLGIVLQPIVNLSTMQIIGVEALSRFTDPPARPDIWFADAMEVGLEEELELLSIECALQHLPMIPDGIYLSVNASPKVACSEALAKLFEASDSARLVLEVTEQSSVSSYNELVSAIARLRTIGVRLAVDDAGAGYASFSHILALQPEIIKLDINLTRNLDQDPVRFSLAEALASFAKRLGSHLVAEGVETQAELDALLRVDAYAVQGYLTARPGPLPLPKIEVKPNWSIVDGTPITIGETLTFEIFARNILKEVVRESSLDFAYITVLSPSEDKLLHLFVEPQGIEVLTEGLVIPWGESLCIRCRDAGLVWTPDIEDDLISGSYADGKGVRTYLSMPIRTPANHSTLGTLCAVAFEHRYLSERVLGRIEGLARQVADRVVRDGVSEFLEFV